MSGDYHHLPILPASASLASHLQALDLLAARLSSLATKTEWETRVPLNSKASIKGSLTNTANVKINIGGEWWVDMTSQEGEAWVRRRKAALLEEHAKVLEGWRPGMETTSSRLPEVKPLPRQPAFDPVFRSPAGASIPSSLQTPGAQQPTPTTSIPEPEAPKREPAKAPALAPKKSTPPSKPTPVVSDVKETARPVNAVAGPSTLSSKIKSSAPPKSLASALSEFMEIQNALAQATGSSSMPTGSAEEAIVNEEGLPIHEIREDENGKLLSDLPELSPGADEMEVQTGQVEEVDDFWSAEAVARREALRRKIFDDPSDSESDPEADEDNLQPLGTPPKPSAPTPSISTIPPTPSSPQPSGPLPTRRPSSSASSITPKSILKSSAPRKKSVSFDSSVPEPPPDSDSPRQSHFGIGGSMFPTPVINIETGIEERVVPTLNAPKRSPKRSTFGPESFAGFKPGFLGARAGPGASVVVSEPTSIASTSTSTPELSELKVESAEKQSTPASDPPRKSLFAQRMSDPEEATASASLATSSPAFPAMSTSTHTSSVRNTIVERPTAVPAPRDQLNSSGSGTGTGTTAGLASTVMERPTSAPGPSRHNQDLDQGDEYDDSDDEDDDFYRDEDDDSEYDLDDALLAREVALAYHQNRAYSQLGQQQARANRGEGGDGDYPHMAMGLGDDDDYEGEEEAGVMMALPEISMIPLQNQDGGPSISMPSIINPTPDDLRRFVRIGKLDNGKLVLAPGEHGWSDEEGEGEDDVKNRNREDIRNVLLGKGKAPGPVREIGERGTQKRERGEQALDMPPTVGSSKVTAGPFPTSAAVGQVVETPSIPVAVPVTDPPKKVSRFKAARMG